MGEDVIERLDEDYGGDGHEQTPAAMDAIRFAVREFRDAVLAVYVPWACERAGRRSPRRQGVGRREPAGVARRFGAGDVIRSVAH